MYIIACKAHFCHLLELGQVGHSPRGTSGSAGTLDWGPMWLDSQSTCQPNAPLHPQWTPNTPTPSDSPNLPDSPTPLGTPWCHLYPCWSLSTYTPCQPPNGPLTPLHPLTAPNSPDTPWDPLGAPLCCLYPCWPLGTYTPCQSPNAPLTPPTPLTVPNLHWWSQFPNTP